MEKKCTKCGEVKSLDEFSNAKKGKHGKHARCKSCFKLYYQDNKEKYKQSNIIWQENNREYRKNISKEYYKKNKEYIRKQHQKWNENNKEKRKIYDQKNKHIRQKYYKENKERIIKKTGEYTKERIKTDPLFKLTCSIRTNIGNSLIKSGYTKKAKSYNILKCEYDFFMNWLNGLASNGHTYGIGELHLDHVIPISLAETEDEAILLSHYSNYQLLSADENLAKSNRYVNPTNLKRVLEHHPNPDKIREIHSRI